MRVGALLLLISSCFGQVSDPSSGHKFFDKTAVFSIGGTAAVLTADAVITCRMLHGGGKEVFLPTQSCAGASAWMASSLAAQTSTAYFLHRTRHHRLERAAEFFWASGSAIGITYTLTHRARKLPMPDSATVMIPGTRDPTFCIVGMPGCGG